LPHVAEIDVPTILAFGIAAAIRAWVIEARFGRPVASRTTFI